MANSVDPDETAHMSRLIWIYAVCKSLLLSPVAVKELTSCVFVIDSKQYGLILYPVYFGLFFFSLKIMLIYVL